MAVFAAVLIAQGAWAQPLQKVTIVYPNRSGSNWPLFLAKDGGYYQKYGLDVDLQFGVHPTGIAMLTSGQAVMVNHSLEQGMVASSKDPDGFALLGSSSNKGLFALIGQKQFTNPKELKGKRIAVGQIGDALLVLIERMPKNYGLDGEPAVIALRKMLDEVAEIKKRHKRPELRRLVHTHETSA